jgi:hypothetical protein
VIQPAGRTSEASSTFTPSVSGQQVCVEAGVAGAAKAPHTTALETETQHTAKNAALVKESNKAF